MSGAVVLLSGGIDSALCLSRAVKQHSRILALTIYYGQKNAQELLAVDSVLQYYRNKNRNVTISHKVLPLTDVFVDRNRSPLVQGGDPITPVRSASNEDLAQGAALVPFRNGVFISVAVTIALNYDCGEVWIGFTGEGARDYPDCSRDFRNGMAQAVRMGTGGAVSLVTPLCDSTKIQSVKMASDEGVPIELTWSCYSDKREPCLVCSACVERENAIKALTR